MKITRGNTTVLDTDLKKDSYTLEEINGQHIAVLEFDLKEPVNFKIDDEVLVLGNRYYIRHKEHIEKKETSLGYEYRVTFYHISYKAHEVAFFPSDKPEFKPNLTYLYADAKMLIELAVKNLNRLMPGWTVGQFAETESFNFSYKDKSVASVLSDAMKEWNLEFWADGMTLNLAKREYSSNGLVLSQGNGFKSLNLSSLEEKPPFTRLYAYGGDTNMNGEYLQLPNGLPYLEKNVDKYGIKEHQHHFDKIFPNPTFKILEVVDNHTFKCDIDFDLVAHVPSKNTDEVIIHFLKGALGGYDFRVVDGSWDNTKKQLKLKDHEDEKNQALLKDVNFAVGDTFSIFNITMPEVHKAKSQQDLLNEAEKLLAEISENRVQLKYECDEIDFAERNIFIACGQLVGIYEPKLNIDREIRAISVKRYLDDEETPYRYEITLSDFLQSNGWDEIIDKIEDNEDKINENKEKGRIDTIRRFRDAIELAGRLDSMPGFDGKISPSSVHAMQMFLGAEYLQYVYVKSKTDTTRVDPYFNMNNDTKTFSIDKGVIQHMTIGIDTLKPSHEKNEYAYWNVAAFNAQLLTSEAKWLYIRASKNSENANYLFSDEFLDFDTDPNYYYLLVGSLGSEYEGERSFVTLFGFSEWTPGALRIDKIASLDGRMFLNLVAGALRLGSKDSFIDFNNLLKDAFIFKDILFMSGSGVLDTVDIYTGLYSPDRQYYRGETVKYEGDIYKCTETPPRKGIPPTNEDYWRLVVSRGNDGIPVMQAFLTNDFFSFPSNEEGKILNTIGANTTIKLFSGATEITSGLTYSFTASAGVTATRSGATISVTDMTTDSGYVDITVVYLTKSYTKRFSLSKNKQGISGSSYWLVPNAQVIEKKGTVYTPSILYFYKKKQSGLKVVEASDCSVICTGYDAAGVGKVLTALNSSGGHVSYSVTSSYVRYVAEMKKDGVMVSQMTVFVVENSETIKDEFAKQLGYDGYDDMVRYATSDPSMTIIEKGRINTVLIDAEAIYTKGLFAERIVQVSGNKISEDGITLAKDGVELTMKPLAIPNLDKFLTASTGTGGEIKTTKQEGTKSHPNLTFSFDSSKQTISNVNELRWSDFKVTGSISANRVAGDNVRGVGISVTVYSIEESPAGLATKFMGAFSDIAENDSAVFSGTITKGTVTPDPTATSIHLRFIVSLSAMAIIGKAPSISYVINALSLDKLFQANTGVKKSGLYIDGYGLALNTNEYFHLKAGSKMLLSYQGDVESNSIMQKLLSIRFGGGIIIAIGGYAVDAGTLSVTGKNGQWIITHNMNANKGIQVNTMNVQATAIDHTATISVQEVWGDRITVNAVDHNGTRVDCEWSLLITKI